jgi:hypothetical protein
MNEKWFDECSVVAYPHEIRFLNIDGGSMSYCVDRNVSEYVRKIQAQLNTLQNENREKGIKNMILQSKIDKAIEYIEENIDLEMDDFTKIDIGCEILKILDLDKYNEFLKEDK